LPPRSASDCFTPALEHTKSQLFRPFRWPQWWRLALVGLFSGELNSGGCNINFPGSSGTHQQGTSQQAFLAALPPDFAAHPLRLLVFFVPLVLIVLALAVVFIYIASIMRFILFDAVATRECHIRQGWRRRKQIGLRFFWWEIAFGAIGLALGLILIGIPALIAWRQGWFAAPGEHAAALISGVLMFFFAFFVLVAVLIMIRVLTKDFVVPQMALEGIGAVEGWRRLLARMQNEKTGYAGYIGMKFVLAIAGIFLYMIALLLAFFLLLIPFGGVAFAAVLGGKGAGLTWNVVTVSIAVAYCCAVFLIFMATAALIGAPVAVFFPAYAMYFFAPRYPPLADLLWPSAPAPVAPPNSPPDIPPPLPPMLPPDPTPLPQ
jgi:hypothetical protein